MNFKKLFVVSIVLCSSILSAGNSSGGGGDTLLPAPIVAWFPENNQNIKYCIELSPIFGVTYSEAESAFRGAVETWKEYYEKNVDNFEHYKKNLNYIQSSKCDGSQDLIIYLGVENSVIAEARKQFSEPLAFVHRTFVEEEILCVEGWRL